MQVEWNRVTWYSKVIALVLFIVVFVFGVFLGIQLNDIVELKQTDGVAKDILKQENKVEALVDPNTYKDQSFGISFEKVEGSNTEIRMDGNRLTATTMPGGINKFLLGEGENLIGGIGMLSAREGGSPWAW